MYNDYGSVKRDEAEGNLNSLDFRNLVTVLMGTWRYFWGRRRGRRWEED